MKNFLLSLFLAVGIVTSLTQVPSVLAVTIPTTLPGDWSTQCTDGSSYFCTNEYIYFDNATSVSNDTITGVGLKRLSCISGVDPIAWLNSYYNGFAMPEYRVGRFSTRLQLDGNITPSSASASVNCSWQSYWLYYSGSWHADHTNGANQVISNIGTYPPLTTTFPIYADSDGDFTGRYGLGNVVKDQLLWNSEGVATGSAAFAPNSPSSSGSPISCTTTDLLCQGQKVFYNIMNFIFGFSSVSQVPERFTSLRTEALAKSPFAYINAIGLIDLSATGTATSAPHLTLDYPGGIPLLHGTGHIIDVDVNSLGAVTWVRDWARPIFVVILWGYFIFGYLLHRGRVL